MHFVTTCKKVKVLTLVLPSYFLLRGLPRGGGGWLPPPLLEFVIRHPMPMTLVPVVSYDPPLTSDTKQVPTYQVYDVTAMKI